MEKEFLKSKEYQVAFDRYKKIRLGKETVDDWVKKFVDSCFVVDGQSEIKASDIQQLYVKWTEENGLYNHGLIELGKNLKLLFDDKRKGDGIYYQGLKMKECK